MVSIEEDLLRELLYIYRSNVGGLVDIEEFREDVQRFFHIARQLRKYDNNGYLNVRLLLNHMQILYNIFGNKTTEVLIEYIDDDLHGHLYAVMFFLYRLPSDLKNEINKDALRLIESEVKNNTI